MVTSYNHKAQPLGINTFALPYAFCSNKYFKALKGAVSIFPKTTVLKNIAFTNKS